MTVAKTTPPATPDPATQAVFDSPRCRQFLDLPHLQDPLCFCEVGDPDGVPVFLVTGAGGCRLMSLLFHASATLTGIRLISFDKPGVGLSGSRPPNQDDHDPFQFVADLVIAIADHLRIQKFGVMAFSLGAMDAVALANSHPERIVSSVQIFGGWTMPNMPNPLKKMKMLTKIPESWIRGCVGTATNVPFDPRYSWLMASLDGVSGGIQSLAGASANLFGSCLGSDGDDDEKDDGLEDGGKEERAFRKNEPAVDHASRLISRIFRWSCIWAKKPAMTPAEAFVVTKAANPKTNWDGGWDISAEMDVKHAKPRAYMFEGLVEDLIKACGKRGNLNVDLATVKTPFHFYHGTEDVLVKPAAVQALAKSMAHAEVTVVRKGTHDMISNARLFRAAAREIVAGAGTAFESVSFSDVPTSA
ncbi:hypothetical protein HKX48_006362 [Thoreauomyces humboldtii]|nr:hypothetical protein HKX48_006362 [Thoreauomyces humboldtii]